MSKKQRISIVSYTNTLPFRHALRNSALMSGIELHEDIPSICAQKLKFGQADLALVPVALLPELTDYFIESRFCIGANGKVDSVKLYSQVPLEKVSTVFLDYQSKSSVTLAKVLCRFFWKLDPEFKEALPGFEAKVEGNAANVVIGDRTFSLNGKFAFEYDLAEEWKKFTGLPFVFAAWVSTRKFSDAFMNSFDLVLANGLDHIQEAVDEHLHELPLSREQAIIYLSDRISYDLDAEKRIALDLFLNYISRL